MNDAHFLVVGHVAAQRWPPEDPGLFSEAVKCRRHLGPPPLQTQQHTLIWPIFCAPCAHLHSNTPWFDPSSAHLVPIYTATHLDFTHLLRTLCPSTQQHTLISPIFCTPCAHLHSNIPWFHPSSAHLVPIYTATYLDLTHLLHTLCPPTQQHIVIWLTWFDLTDTPSGHPTPIYTATHFDSTHLTPVYTSTHFDLTHTYLHSNALWFNSPYTYLHSNALWFNSHLCTQQRTLTHLTPIYTAMHFDLTHTCVHSNALWFNSPYTYLYSNTIWFTSPYTYLHSKALWFNSHLCTQ